VTLVYTIISVRMILFVGNTALKITKLTSLLVMGQFWSSLMLFHVMQLLIVHSLHPGETLSNQDPNYVQHSLIYKSILKSFGSLPVGMLVLISSPVPLTTLVLIIEQPFR